MPVYLVENPPRIRQYRSPRRERPSGVVVVHTAESFPDEVGPDTGAENTARFIELRTNHGSYHDLVDSDSIIQMVRYSDEAFHDATGSNPHSYGVSAATQAAKWNQLSSDWVDATVHNMARATARYARWVETEHGVTIPARRISRAQSERRVPGFISHAERDPDRRTDPGRYFPWDDFLGYYADEMNGDIMPATVTAPNGETWPVEKALSWMMEALRSVRQDQVVTAPNGETWGEGHATGWLMGHAVKDRDATAQLLANQQAIMAAQGVEVDEAALAQQIAAVLVPAVIAALPDAGLTAEQVEDATERAVREVLGSLND